MENNNPIIEFAARRHKTIGSLAQEFIKSTLAEKEVAKLLEKINASSLEEIADWADKIKPTSKNKPTDSETKDFLTHFPDTREWHFVDLPLDATSYDVQKYRRYIRKDDVVHALMESINILMGNSNKFSKPNALRWLVHLMGDIHQPLHIACSYIDYNKAIPELVFNSNEVLIRNLLKMSDKGGNKIVLPIGGSGKSLHQYWDSDLPEMDNDFSTVKYDNNTMISKTELLAMPSEWVGENVQYAKEAYKGLTVIGRNNKDKTAIDIKWDQNSYNQRCIPLIKEMSIKAGQRLAYTLICIYS